MDNVRAIVLAAGQSRRMGNHKLLLPWDGGTVIGRVISVLEASLGSGAETVALKEIVVVTGHQSEAVAEALRHSTARVIFNPHYAEGDMLSSVQAGLASLDTSTQAALLCLGDQPQIQVEAVQAVLAAGKSSAWQEVIVPSYQMRAGHPILLPKTIWPAVLNAETHLRAVLARHAGQVRYVTLDCPSILADLDTPEDYERAQGNVLD